MDEQRRQAHCRKADLAPAVARTPKSALLAQAELRENASASSEVPAKPVPSTKPQPLPVPAVQARRKHVLVPKSAGLPSTSTTLADPNPNNDPPSQLELRVMAGVEPSKPTYRRRGKEPQLTRAELFQPYSLSPNDVAPRPIEAGRRRRRTSIAMG